MRVKFAVQIISLFAVCRDFSGILDFVVYIGKYVQNVVLMH